MVLVALASAVALGAPAGGALAASSPPARPDPGSIGVSLVAEPDSSDPPSPYITNRIAPGGTVTRQISVSNTTADTVAVTMYAAGASFSGGRFEFAERGTSSEASSYTVVTPASLELGAGSSTLVTVTISPPTTAAPGLQYGVVWAEVGAADPGKAGIVQVNRVGIREYLSIGPGGLAPADFTLSAPSSTLGNGGVRQIAATVRNTGGSVLDLSSVLVLSEGPGGSRAGPFSAGLNGSLLPGDSGPVLIALPADLPLGTWTVELTVTSGELSRTRTATLQLDGTAVTQASRPAWQLGLALLVGIGAVSILGLRLRRRRRPQQAASTDEVDPYPQPTTHQPPSERVHPRPAKPRLS